MKKIIFIILGIIILIGNILVIKFVYEKEEKNTIPENYFIVFKGETSETVYSTYVYKKKKKKKIEYKYINTVSTPIGYDSTEWNEKVIKKGTVKKIDKVYEVALNNNANSYTKIAGDDKVYTIDEIRNIFK